MASDTYEEARKACEQGWGCGGHSTLLPPFPLGLALLLQQEREQPYWLTTQHPFSSPAIVCHCQNMTSLAAPFSMGRLTPIASPNQTESIAAIWLACAISPYRGLLLSVRLGRPKAEAGPSVNNPFVWLIVKRIFQLTRLN